MTDHPAHAKARHMTAPTASASSLRTRLDILHDHYVEAINLAVAADDDRRVADLAADYHHEAVRMIVDHEGRPGPVPASLLRPPARRHTLRFRPRRHGQR
jgi:hypothetical protein